MLTFYSAVNENWGCDVLVIPIKSHLGLHLSIIFLEQ